MTWSLPIDAETCPDGILFLSVKEKSRRSGNPGRLPGVSELVASDHHLVMSGDALFHFYDLFAFLGFLVDFRDADVQHTVLYMGADIVPVGILRQDHCLLELRV